MSGNTLVIAQVALCVLVIAAAGLLVRSLRNLQTLDAGFERENVLLFNLDTRGPEWSPARREGFYSGLLDRLHALPGVQSAAYSTRSPVDLSSVGRRIYVPGVDAEGRHSVSTNVVTPEYFQVFGMRLIRGRGFTAQDRDGAPKAAVVSDSTARFYFGQSDPLGRTLRLGGNKESIAVVGVVRDVRHERLREEAPPKMLYTPLAQTATMAAGLDGIVGMPERLTAEVRTSGDLATLAASVRSEVRALNKDVAVHYVRTMEQQLDAALVSERVVGTLSTAFGLLALLLTSVGLYGVMSYGVARRTHEMGIRVALGARRDQVLGMILREVMFLAGAGILIGVAVAMGLTRYIQALLYGVQPIDPVTIAGAVGLMIVVALLAGWIPARRASRLEPMVALRHE